MFHRLLVWLCNLVHVVTVIELSNYENWKCSSSFSCSWKRQKMFKNNVQWLYSFVNTIDLQKDSFNVNNTTIQNSSSKMGHLDRLYKKLWSFFSLCSFFFWIENVETCLHFSLFTFLPLHFSKIFLTTSKILFFRWHWK